MNRLSRNVKILDDDQIIELFFSRNPSAIEETQRKYARYLFSVARNLLTSKEDCEECINDTYLALWDSIPPHHPRSLKMFATSILRKHATDIYRKKSRQKRIPSELILSLNDLEYCLSDSTFSDDEQGQKQLAQALNTFLKNLSKEERALFVARYYLGQSVADIAHALNISTYAVYRSLSKQRVKLREFLIKEGYTV